MISRPGFDKWKQDWFLYDMQQNIVEHQETFEYRKLLIRLMSLAFGGLIIIPDWA